MYSVIVLQRNGYFDYKHQENSYNVNLSQPNKNKEIEYIVEVVLKKRSTTYTVARDNDKTGI